MFITFSPDGSYNSMLIESFTRINSSLKGSPQENLKKEITKSAYMMTSFQD